MIQSRTTNPQCLMPDARCPMPDAQPQKLGSIRHQRIAQRKEIDADQRAFVKILIVTWLSFFLFLAIMLVPDAWWQYIDSANQLIAASVAWGIAAIIGIKLIVGKRKMW